ncbi:MAG: DNA mismatch repair endonuclease MutL [Bacilli bacterium]
MNIIKVMDENLSNKIAAGEVIEKIMNVVKELVENGIDANSSAIKIELIDSGIKTIKITDNGCGMSKEDAVNAFLRHATSKLKKDEDLFSISTLGFRGEAMPSIASISKVTLETTNKIDKTKIIINGGKIEEVSASNIDEGTIITVNDLFYNTPVRLKYLSNLYSELASITQYVSKMAISFPNIRFILINNDKILLKTDGQNNLLKVINTIYGLEVAKKMIPINYFNDDYKVTGFISYPEISRSNRNSITVLVNNRYIKNNIIINDILEGYHTYMLINKYPVVIINIIVDPILIDVNIHPTKMDIKFSKMNDLNYLLSSEINKTLKSLLTIPDIKNNDVIDIKEELEKEYNKPIIEVDSKINIQEDLFKIEENNNIEYNKTLKELNYVGIALSTYIICENTDGMYIIDQHAAAERINYEKYLNNLTSEVVTKSILLVPFTIELSLDEYIIFKENEKLFESIGYTYEEFGINTILIREHPSYLGDYIIEKTRKIIDIIISKEAFSKEKFIEKVAITLACKMSIKANDYISEEDVKYLINNLITCKNPFNCPHGRPTIIAYSKYELEKLFKRSI